MINSLKLFPLLSNLKIYKLFDILFSAIISICLPAFLENLRFLCLGINNWLVTHYRFYNFGLLIDIFRNFFLQISLKSLFHRINLLLGINFLRQLKLTLLNEFSLLIFDNHVLPDDFNSLVNWQVQKYDI